jgi:hypothetical protein
MTKTRSLAFKSGFEGQVDPFVHDSQRLGDGEGCIGGDLERQRLGPLHQLASGDDFIDEADAERLVGIDDRASEQELERGATADQPRQPLCSAVATDDAEFYFWLAQARIVRS